MTEKTQAMRALEGKKIAYEVLTYSADTRDAEEVAQLIGLSPNEVFKTLVVMPPEPGRKPLLVMIPADKQLNLKQLALATGAKKLKMATQREAEQLTGLQVGGISAVALLNKGFSVFIDRSVQAVPLVCISAGKRGFQIRLPATALIKVTNARVVDITSDE